MDEIKKTQSMSITTSIYAYFAGLMLLVVLAAWVDRTFFEGNVVVPVLEDAASFFKTILNF